MFQYLHQNLDNPDLWQCPNTVHIELHCIRLEWNWIEWNLITPDMESDQPDLLISTIIDVTVQKKTSNDALAEQNVVFRQKFFFCGKIVFYTRPRRQKSVHYF